MYLSHSCLAPPYFGFGPFGSFKSSGHATMAAGWPLGRAKACCAHPVIRQRSPSHGRPFGDRTCHAGCAQDRGSEDLSTFRTARKPCRPRPYGRGCSRSLFGKYAPSSGVPKVPTVGWPRAGVEGRLWFPGAGVAYSGAPFIVAPGFVAWPTERPRVEGAVRGVESPWRTSGSFYPLAQHVLRESTGQPGLERAWGESAEMEKALCSSGARLGFT